MDKDSIEAVISHEVAHIANGDMVTMTLLQGVVNAFVMFLARIMTSLTVSILSKHSDDNRRPGFIYFILVLGFEIVFMLLGNIIVSAFSRYREYRADAGGANLTSKAKMIKALESLKINQNKILDESGD